MREEPIPWVGAWCSSDEDAASTRPTAASGIGAAMARLPPGWESRYVVRDPSRVDEFLIDTDQSLCIVRDLSTKGIGLELDDTDISVGDALVIDLHLTEHRRAASIRLRGVVRHASTNDSSRGPVRAGVEFVDIGNLERALIHQLLRDRSDATRQAG